MEDKRELFCPDCSTKIGDSKDGKELLKESVVCKKCKTGITENNVIRL